MVSKNYWTKKEAMAGTGNLHSIKTSILLHVQKLITQLPAGNKYTICAKANNTNHCYQNCYYNTTGARFHFFLWQIIDCICSREIVTKGSCQWWLPGGGS